MVENCQSITDLILSPQQKINFESGNTKCIFGLCKTNWKQEKINWFMKVYDEAGLVCCFLKRKGSFIPIIHSVFVWQIKKGPHFYAYSISLTRIKKFIIYHPRVWKNELLRLWMVVHSLVLCFLQGSKCILLNKSTYLPLELEDIKCRNGEGCKDKLFNPI